MKQLKKDIESMIKEKYTEMVMNNNLTESNRKMLILFYKNYKLADRLKEKTDMRLLSNLISGQNHLAANENKRFPETPPYCEACPQYPETAEHFLTTCDKYTHQRLKHFHTTQCSIEYIMETISLRDIIKFTKETKRLEIMEDEYNMIYNKPAKSK